MKTARVTEEHKTNYIISIDDRELTATVRGSFFTESTFPKVGDFVRFEEVGDDKATIEEIIPRTSTVARKAVETGDVQVIVTNVHIIFIVVGLDNDFNLSRLERYLLLAKQSDIQPVVILNKCDSVEDISEYIEQVAAVAGDIPVHAVSALTGLGMETMLKYFTPDTTAVLLGSSGAGKSTITNWLLRADMQPVNDVRENDSRGKHTTTSRQLFALPGGGYLIDTPGMRELGVLDSSSEDEDIIFSKIELLSRQCRFTNCDHDKSAGCAVLAAIESNEISERELKNYLKLQRERLHEESKNNDVLSHKQKQKLKKLEQTYDDAQEKKRFDNHF